MMEHEDVKFERWLQDAAKSYHTPHPTPREEMWARIAAERRRRHVVEIGPWMRWALAAAAVLAVGISLGRLSVRQPSPGDVTPVAAAGPNAVIYEVAATQYLSRAEAFLTGFRVDPPAAAGNARFVRQARDLLITTRLLLDSPASEDARVRSLLEDLELILAQIAGLDADAGAGGRDMITQSLNQSNVLPKLRSAIPAGPVAVRTEGAL